MMTAAMWRDDTYQTGDRSEAKGATTAVVSRRTEPQIGNNEPGVNGQYRKTGSARSAWKTSNQSPTNTRQTRDVSIKQWQDLPAVPAPEWHRLPEAAHTSQALGEAAAPREPRASIGGWPFDSAREPLDG